MPINELKAAMTESLILIAVLAVTVAYELITSEKPANEGKGAMMGRMSVLDIALRENVEEGRAKLLEGIGCRFLKLAKLKREVLSASQAL